MKESQAKKFCRCVKQVAATVQLRPGSGRGKTAKESAAIAICVSKMLQSRGRTLKRFSCKKKGGPSLQTQTMKSKR
jgi:hypothetical protein